MNLINIKGLPSAVVFAALYNNAVVKGFAFRTPFDGKMSVEQAQTILDDLSEGSETQLIEEWGGRIIGVDFSQDEFDATSYDRANRPGDFNGSLAQMIIDRVRQLIDEATQDFWVLTPVPS